MASKSDTANTKKRCDCTARKQDNCEHAWHVDWKPRDRPRVRGRVKEFIGYEPSNRAAAEAAVEQMQAAMLAGKDPKVVAAADHFTVEQMLNMFAEDEPRKVPSEIPLLCSFPLPSPRGGKTLGSWLAREFGPEQLMTLKKGRPEVAFNRQYALLRRAFNWALDTQRLPSTPCRSANGRPTVRMHKEFSRWRRLAHGEYERLLAAAGPDMRDVIVCAVETGMRSGEIAKLQWRQVRFAGPEIVLEAKKTKGRRPRVIPISKALMPILERRRLDPKGDALGPSCYVFGDEVGRKVASRDTAWRATVLRANGHTPSFTVTTEIVDGKARRKKNLSEESRALFESFDLTFHDLRREAGSRWLDSKVVSLTTIQMYLGHAKLSTTIIYLAAPIGDGHAAMVRFDEQREVTPNTVTV